MKQRIEKQGYSECECGGLIIDNGHEWLGEDENGKGRTKVFEMCEDCGQIFTSIISE
jgi:hypothetical protein